MKLPNGSQTGLPEPSFAIKWRDQGVIETRQGNRHLFTAAIPDGFWDYWNLHKDDMRKHGFSCGKDNKTGRWMLNCWMTAGATAKEDSFSKDLISMSRADRCNKNFATAFPSGVTPYGYQEAGIEYALSVKSGKVIIGDDMGLGKTLQAIGICNITKPSSVLVICPASLRLNWADEWSKFSLQSDSLSSASVLKKADIPLIAKNDVIFISYDLASLPAAQNLIRARKWGVLIADEAHFLANHKTGRSVGVLGLPPRVRSKKPVPREPIAADRYLFLTGTPVSNRPINFWNLLRFCNPENFGNRTKFTQRYCGERKSPFGNGWDETGKSNLEELQAIVRGTCMVRRLKTQVLKQLPAKTRKIVPLLTPSEVIRELDPLTMEYRTSKETAEKAKAKVAKAKKAGDSAELQSALDDLKQAKSSLFNETSKIRKSIGVAKVDLAILHLEEVLNEGGGKSKVIVGAHHTEVVAKLFEGLQKFNPVVISGSTGAEQRHEAVAKFQNDDSCRVFIGNILAAGTGLTLTASPHVVIVEPDWVPANNTQFEDRAWRIGQDKPVLIEYLAMEGTIDIQILRANASKMETIESLVDRESDLERGASKIQFGPKGPATPLPSGEESREQERKIHEGRMNTIKLGQSLSPREIMAAHRCVKDVAIMDGDHASARNNEGFSKVDSEFGGKLARTRLQDLTDFQKGRVAAMAWKYRRQCKEELVNQLRNLRKTEK